MKSVKVVEDPMPVIRTFCVLDVLNDQREPAEVNLNSIEGRFVTEAF